MGVTGNCLGEFWWSWVCAGAKSIPGATLLTSAPHAFSIGSSFVFSPELTGPGIWSTLLLQQLLLVWLPQ